MIHSCHENWWPPSHLLFALSKTIPFYLQISKWQILCPNLPSGKVDLKTINQIIKSWFLMTLFPDMKSKWYQSLISSSSVFALNGWTTNEFSRANMNIPETRISDTKGTSFSNKSWAAPFHLLQFWTYNTCICINLERLSPKSVSLDITWSFLATHLFNLLLALINNDYLKLKSFANDK